MVRLSRIARLPLLAMPLLLASVPAQAGVTNGGNLQLSPASGQVGSHFTATFVYSVAVCSEWSVHLWWGSDTASGEEIGDGTDTGTGQSCQVAIRTAVPADATPGQSYSVIALTSPHNASVSGGPGPTGQSSFAVVGAPPQTGGSSGSSTKAGVGSTPAATRPAEAPTSSSTSTSTSGADSGSASSSDGTSQSAGTSSSTSSAPVGSSRHAPAAVSQPKTVTPGWRIVLVAVLLIGGGVGLGWAYRSGVLRRR